MDENLSSKSHWKKSIQRQKDANNLLSDKLRTARRVVKAQATEINELREAVEILHVPHDEYSPLCRHCVEKMDAEGPW